MLAAARHVELPGTHCLDEVTGGLPNDSADAALLDFHRGSHMHEDGGVVLTAHDAHAATGVRHGAVVHHRDCSCYSLRFTPMQYESEL